jgi:FixJ family two-component response regulator
MHRRRILGATFQCKGEATAMLSTDVTPIIHLVSERLETRVVLAAYLRRMEWLPRAHDGLPEKFASVGAGAGDRGCIVVELSSNRSGSIDLQRLWRSEPGLPVVVISPQGDVETAVQAMKDGAFDCLEPPFRDREFLDSVAGALREEAAHRATRERNVNLRDRVSSLTRREREVMWMLGIGSINKVIASRLGVSRRTVEFHRNSVMRKMGAPSLAHLINMCLQLDATSRSAPVGADHRGYSYGTTDAVL